MRLKYQLGDSTWALGMRSLLQDHPREPATSAAEKFAEQHGWQPPSHELVWAARLARIQGRFTKAARLTERALEGAGDDDMSLKRRIDAGNYRRKAGHHKYAARHFSSVMNDAPGTSFAAKAIKGMAALERGRNREAKSRSWEERFLREFPNHEEAVDSRWQTAWGWARQRRWLDAAQTFSEVAEKHPDWENADMALWRQGFCLYRAGRIGSAYGVLGNLANDGKDYVAVDQAAYWASKLALELGLPTESSAWLELAASFAPRSYYSLKAASDLKRPFSPNSEPPQNDPSEIAQTPTAAILASCGALGWARGILSNHHVALSSKTREIDRVTEAYVSIGDWARAMRFGAQSAWRVRGPGRFHELSGSRLRRAYPAYVEPDVRQSALRNNLNPAILWAVIRQESVFDPLAHSAAEARGLMQIMPATGRALAKRNKITGYRTEDLYHPTTSVTFGSALLAELLQSFGGSLEQVLAAYNAGPRHAKRWWRISSDVDVVIESITYKETRKYVKLVMRNYWIYQALYPASVDGE